MRYFLFWGGLTIRVIISGALGRVGSAAARAAEAEPGVEVCGLVDVLSHGGKILSSLEEVTEAADVIIDFSHHSLTGGILDFSRRRGCALVLGTTGHTREELENIKAMSGAVPIFMAANMSLGVAVLTELVARAAELMPEADAEIVEAHHRRKIDSPSGTALGLAAALRGARGGEIRAGRGPGERPSPREITVHSLRMGNIAGTHTVILSSPGETLTLTHTAQSPELFVKGALRAARFIVGRGPGLYGIAELIVECGEKRGQKN